jgi:hypothetical protein
MQVLILQFKINIKAASLRRATNELWHTRLAVGNAALVITLSDLSKLQMGINAFLLYIMLMIGTFVLRAMLKKR